jgi:uncharacterized protein (DUF1778 family)
MQVNTTKNKTMRFDAHLSVEQKTYFEKAVQLGGYRDFTEFIIAAGMEKAGKIIAENEQIILSQRDSEIFFEAIFQQACPNSALVEAVNEYKQYKQLLSK